MGDNNYSEAIKQVKRFGQDGYWAVAFKNGSFETLDGGHDDIGGVQKAIKLHIGIFGPQGYNWEMATVKDERVEFSPVPEVNEEAVNICNQLIRGFRRWK